MNVLFVTPWYPTVDDPAGGVFVQDFARAAARTANVRVLHLDWQPGEARGHTEPPAIRFRVPARGSAGYLLSAGAAAGGVARLLAHHRFVPDVVHGHVWKVAPHAWLIARATRAAWVQTEHWTGFGRGQATSFQKALTRWTYRRADRVLPVSQPLADTLAQIVTANIEIVWNVVDTELFHPPTTPATGASTFLMVGYLDAIDRKNIAGTLHGLATITTGSWTATIIGDGPGRPQLEQLAARLGINRQVTFAGAVDRVGVADAMRRHRFLVHPSTFETFSIVVGEALVSGLPVIGTDTGVIRALIERTGGGVVVRNQNELAAALTNAATGRLEVDRNTTASAAKRLLDPSRLVADLDRIYREVTTA